MKPFARESFCDCGNKTTNDAGGRYVCDTCRAAYKRAQDFGLLNDRVKRSPDEHVNREYASRYSKAYHRNKHLPKAERCAIARAEAAIPLSEYEATMSTRLCKCGYPSVDGEDKCVVCKLL